MPYEDIPSRYQPYAVSTRASSIAQAITGMVLSDKPRAEIDLLLQRYIADLNQQQEEHAANLLRIVIEQGGDAGREAKASYMLRIARSVAYAEVPELSQQAQAAGQRQAATDLGLEYFVQNPQTFLNALGATTRPDQQDLNRIGRLLESRPMARANQFIALPATAALAPSAPSTLWPSP